MHPTEPTHLPHGSRPDGFTQRKGDRSFAEAVHAVVRQIPEGTVTSYGAVAALAGSPRAARGVGAVLNGLPPDTDVPWWRVVNRRGDLSIPAELGLRALQRTLLEAEGVAFLPSGGVDLDRHAWRGPDGSDEDPGEDPDGPDRDPGGDPYA